MAVDSERLLLAATGSAPFAPSSAAVIVTEKAETPDATGPAIVTAKSPVPVAPAASPPVLRVQTEPALLSGEQDQPAVEFSASKLV